MTSITTFPRGIKILVTLTAYILIGSLFWLLGKYWFDSQNLVLDSFDSLVIAVAQVSLLFYASASFVLFASFLGYLISQNKAIKITSLVVSVLSAFGIVTLYIISL